LQLTEDPISVKYHIQSYQPGQIVIKDQHYTKTVLISSTSVKADWGPQSINELSEDDINRIASKEYEILLIGTGEQQIFLAPQLMAVAPCGIEVMTTKAACSTFNLLANEGRAVIAALFL